MRTATVIGYAAVASSLTASFAHAQSGLEKTMYRFDLGAGAAPDGWQKVTPETSFTDARGFGIWTEPRRSPSEARATASDRIARSHSR
jgi:hypothetical protein